jgi:chromosome segregation ATPase
MSELKQMENQLGQLIGMVAKIKETTDKTSQDLTDLRQELTGLRQEFNIEKDLNKARFEEILKEVRNSKFEMEHLRNKTAKLESDLYTVKQTFHLD